jgi:biopolymer transport protein TolR
MGAPSSGGGDDDGCIAAINVTPMVDLTLVLLIIFMVAAPLLASASSIKVNLPKAVAAETTASSPLTLTLTREAGGPRLYANGKPTDEAAVRRLVPALLAKDHDLQAIVSADEGIDYGRVMHLVDVIKSLGVAKFALSTEAQR